MKGDCIHFYRSLCFAPYFICIFFIISHLDILGCLTVFFYFGSTLVLQINFYSVIFILLFNETSVSDV